MARRPPPPSTIRSSVPKISSASVSSSFIFVCRWSRPNLYYVDTMIKARSLWQLAMLRCSCSAYSREGMQNLFHHVRCSRMIAVITYPALNKSAARNSLVH
jgi:hypothetical protein